MNYNTKKYSRLNLEKRYQISFLFNVQKESISKIAQTLNIHKSTISRELKRNLDNFGHYFFEVAQQKTNLRKKYRSLFKHHWALENEFDQKFQKYYNKNIHGVKATINKIKTENPKMKIPSFQTIYRWIKTTKWIFRPSNKLRQYYKKGGKRTKTISRLLDVNKYVLPIWARRKSINTRKEFGHWEMDLVIGKKAHKKQNLLVIVERKSRLGLAIKVISKNPFEIHKKLNMLIKKYDLTIKSITIDNGIEFEKISIFGKQKDIQIYRAEPYASFQRGSNEHFNGLIRRFFKKGTDFNDVSDDLLEDVVNQINEMPREIFNWDNSKNLFLKEKLNHNKENFI
ncbi:IS30 family transposase [Mycoplasmopsis synoviae]|nr:IS30 family transposase [Mycoplasmopsis synoviae]QGL45031.1 IS30 family transposase [Mycoplasmopsis synoviae]QGL45077.1 IS30 family transposase [Mycoplasmopsis synoviae]QGL45278.1 IS30 family transposase [Mycoplasmopsis synoviae]QXV99698.1 IS30 family transposase [Mycoplasmopsis synoviae]UBM43893.1 IS30 family transposase [Mycoplasmopsis synoviae]